MKNPYERQVLQALSGGSANLDAANPSSRTAHFDGTGSPADAGAVRVGSVPGNNTYSPVSKWLLPGLLLFVVMPFLFWRLTWFGGRMSDLEMGQSLRDTSVPHKTQHALSQLAERLARGDPAAKQWNPQLMALAGSSEPQFRLMTAWAMGQDNTSPQFHEVLLKLVHDPVPMVRWNAALSLIRFGDAAGQPEIKFMLRPSSLLAPQTGTLDFGLREKDEVRAGGLVARIKTGTAAAVELRSPLAGRLERELKRDGAAVQAGEPLAILTPGEQQVWEALRALYLVGRRDDLPDVDRFARGVDGMSERVRVQAQLAAEAVRKRSAH